MANRCKTVALLKSKEATGSRMASNLLD
jgi:hypothetical protein